MIDSFERLNLLDGWIRNELTSALPGTVTTLLVGRRGPNVAWRTAPGWRTLLGELMVGPMTAGDVDPGERFDGVRTVPTDDGIPALADALTVLVCDVHDECPAGDHTVVLGRVRAVLALRAGTGLDTVSLRTATMPDRPASHRRPSR